MEIRILQEEELTNAAGLSRYVFDNCLRNRMEFVQTISFVEQYLGLQNLSKMRQEGKLVLWGMFEQGELIAVSALQSDGMITMLYVLPQFQRRGIGRKLLWEMRAYARDTYGFEKVSLNATPAWTAFYFTDKGFSYANPKQSVRVPFVSMIAWSKDMLYQKKEAITGKLVAIVALGLFAFATIAGGIYMIGYIG